VGSCAAGEYCYPPDATCGGGWPDGYCSKKCSSDNPQSPGCPTGSVCTRIEQPTGRNSIYRCLKTCTSHQDCRMPGTGYVCQPTRMSDSCQPGHICEVAPATLPRGPWSANLVIPAPVASSLESEGNVSTDGQGHVAISSIGISNGASIELASVYSEQSQGFPNPAVYGYYPATEYTSDPVVGYDAEAAGAIKPLYLVWLNVETDSAGNPSTTHVLIGKSVNNGATIGPPNNMATAAATTLGQDISGNDGLDFIDKPWVAASNGHIYVTYAVFNGNGERMVYSDDAGVTWSAPRSIGSGGGFQNFGQVAIATQTGDIFVTYGTGPMAAARWLRSTNRTWFDTSVDIPGSDNLANPAGNAVARDGSHFWAVWDDVNASGDGSNIRTAVAANASAGSSLSFAQPVYVNDDRTCGDHIHGTVAVDPNGIGHVLWLDNRYSAGTVQGVVHYARSTDASGQSFTTPEVVSDTLFPFFTGRIPGLWLGDYIGIGIGGGKVYAAWADPRGGRATHFYLSSRSLQ
jgi:hypothetical protein